MCEERVVRRDIKSVFGIQRSVVVYPEENPRGQQAPILLLRTLTDHFCLRSYLEDSHALFEALSVLYSPPFWPSSPTRNRLHSLIFLQILPRRIVFTLVSLYTRHRYFLTTIPSPLAHGNCDSMTCFARFHRLPARDP